MNRTQPFCAHHVFRSARHALGIVIPACFALMVAGCGATVTVGNGGSGGGNSGGNGGGNAGDDEIILRFINDSDADVDTQFYATNDMLDNPSNDLFVPMYRIQAGIGVTGTGILVSDSEDEITFPCSSTTIVGTEGGEFRDPNLGTPLQQGSTRLLRVGENFDCGNTLIFSYTGSAGSYQSRPPVVDSRD